MKKRIDQLLAGKFEHNTPQLIFSKEQIAVKIRAGESIQEELKISASDGSIIRGMISSSSRRLVPGITEFNGKTISLTYGIDTVGLEPGDHFTEYLFFTTNIGEFRLKAEIETEKKEMEAGGGKITSLEAFAESAKSNFKEAFRAFCDNNFAAELLPADDNAAIALYEGFRQQPITFQNMEEYLIALGLKEPVRIHLGSKNCEIYNVTENVSQSLRILKNTWGHLHLEVETVGDFIEPGRHTITADDFIGKTYSLTFIINSEKLGKGIKYGKIVIKTPYQTLEFEIKASSCGHSKGGLSIREQRGKLNLWKEYLAYICRKTEKSAYIISSNYELNRLFDSGCEYPEYRLYQAYILHCDHKDSEANEILKSFRTQAILHADIEMAGIYLYLCHLTGLYSDQKKTRERIYNFYEQKRDSLLLVSALLELDETYTQNKAEALQMLEELFRRGCNNPVLYAKAYQIIKEDENLLNRITPFWTQVLLFAGRRGLLTEGIVMRMAYLMKYEKTFNRSLYSAASYACRMFESADIVEAICRYIMLENPRRQEYFKWYELAVKHRVKITRIFEYYMETMDMSYRHELPRKLLMYFAYSSETLGETGRAYLYANVIEHKLDSPEIYKSYLPQMQDFAEKKLREHKISEDFSALYQEFIKEPSAETAADLSKQLFVNRLYCDNNDVHTVIVKHRQLVKEEEYILSNGVAYPRIYTRDAAVLFRDAMKRRYSKTINYNCKRLMDDDLRAEAILKLEKSDPGLLLYYVENNKITRENIEIFRSVTQNEAFTGEYRALIRKKLLKYYNLHSRSEKIEGYIRRLEDREYIDSDKALYLDTLIKAGLYDKAYGAVSRYGFEGIRREQLLKLTSWIIGIVDFDPDQELFAMASEAYREGIYDENILKYLMRYKNSQIDEMLRIRESAKGFDLDVFDFSERLLMLLMFTRDYRKEGESVLEDYAENMGKERIIGAYLCMLSYGYLIKEFTVSKYIEKCLMRAHKEKWPVNIICRIALLKDLCKGKENYNIEIKDELLSECIKEGFVFAFFRKLPQELLAQYQLDDKVFVETHAAKDSRVTLYYKLESAVSRDEEFKSMPVVNMYEGIFTKAFTLFYGEKLKYYFSVETDGEIRNSKERVLVMEQSVQNPLSKYQQINAVLKDRADKDTEKMMAELKALIEQQNFVKEMFSIKREGKQNE